MNHVKVFTVQQANQLLPKLTGMIDEIRSKRKVILNLEVEIDALELVSDRGGNEHVPANLQGKLDLYNQTVNKFYALIDEVHSLGCFLKDIDLGLIDFYSHNKGKIVYLCWMYGETEVNQWHEVGEGYSSRRPLGPGDPS